MTTGNIIRVLLKRPRNSLAVVCISPSSFLNFASKRTLVNKYVRPKVDKPKPWPYREKNYTFWHQQIDFTWKRIDESSKLIVVEGNIGSGKTSLAKELANAFDFYYLREPTMDDIFINSYGSDMRDYYHLLPPRCRFFDVKMFYEDPAHVNSAHFQYQMMCLKYENYYNALAHILNTGQGVVMDRSYFSDHVFVDACTKKKVKRNGELMPVYSEDFRRVYNRVADNVQPFLYLYPHLVIYLDTPAEVCLERIKKRNIPYEVNSPIMDLEYLKLIEDSYKQKFLKFIDRHSATLIYDWTVPGDPEVVVEDIEALDLGDTFDYHKGDRFETWHINGDRTYFGEEKIGRLRSSVTTKATLRSNFRPSFWDCGEMLYSPNDLVELQSVLEEHHFGKYQYGENLSKGDSLWRVLFGKWPQMGVGATQTTIADRWVEWIMKDVWWAHAHLSFGQFGHALENRWARMCREKEIDDYHAAHGHH